LTDGILTALTLASNKVIHAQDPVDMSLALRISLAASLSSAFVFWVAEYARLRGDLVHAERQLNLTSHGRLAATHLGKAVLREAIIGAVFSSCTSFLGALLPLIIAVLLPSVSWLAIVAAVVALGALGVIVARSIYANPILWAIALITSGIFLTIMGIELHVV
jgi:predicted membrane protein (TIGR00267 family)